jgi:hypothetical protein
MTIIPFPQNTPDKDETTKSSLLATYYTLEEQIELLNTQIQAKEENLQALAHWRNSETFRQYQKETDMLRRERVLLEKTQQIVMKELMKKKEQD